MKNLKKFLCLIIISILILPTITMALELRYDNEITFNEGQQEEAIITLDSYNSSGNVDGIVTMGAAYSETSPNSTSYIVKYNKNKEQVWKTKLDIALAGINIPSLVEGYNSAGNVDGYIISGYNYSNESSYMIKIGLDGKIIWNKPTIDETYIYSDIITDINNEGKVDGYVVTALSYNADSDYCGSYILKFDINGNFTSKFNGYFGNKDTNLESITKSYDENNNFNGYYITGNTNSTSIFDLKYGNYRQINSNDDYANLILKVDKDFNTEYLNINLDISLSLPFTLIESYNESQLPDGCVFVGTDENGIAIIKADTSGKIIWKKQYNDVELSGLEYLYDVSGKITGYVVSATQSGSGLSQLMIVYDLNGNILYQDRNTNYASVSVYYSKAFNSYILSGAKVLNYPETADRRILPTNEVSSIQPQSNTKQNAVVKKLASPINFLDSALIFYSYPKGTISKTEQAVSHGKVQIDEQATIGSTVHFRVEPDLGYIVDKVKVTNTSKKEVETTKQNNDYSFVMPEGGVSIDVQYKAFVNPTTTTFWYIILGIVVIVSISTFIVSKSNKTKSVKKND